MTVIGMLQFHYLILVIALRHVSVKRITYLLTYLLTYSPLVNDLLPPWP